MVMANGSSRPRRTVPKPRISSAARVKKTLNVVDTNLGSYDKKDPFAAADTLRKLLTSVSTRPTACQYKLTPEEYVLSMHLLTIVEPVRTSFSSGDHVKSMRYSYTHIKTSSLDYQSRAGA